MTHIIHPIDQMTYQPGADSKSPLQEGVRLHPGKVFTGTVVQNFNDGRVLVTLGGKPFLAHTTLHLTRGQTHHFQVKTLNPHIELQVLDKNLHVALSPIQIWASTRHLRRNLSRILIDLADARNRRTLNTATCQTLNSLSRLLPAVIYSRPGHVDAGRLSGLLLGSGLFWESKIAGYLLGDKQSHWSDIWMKDLKGILLSLNRSLSPKGAEDPHIQSMAQHIKDALHLIEQDQFFNLSIIKEGLGWFWFIPGMEDRGFQQAEIFVENQESGEEIRLSISLEFTRLGQVDISVSMIGTGIAVKIMVGDDEKTAFITRHLPLLEKAFQGAGLNVRMISCETDETGGQNVPFISIMKGDAPAVHLVI